MDQTLPLWLDLPLTALVLTGCFFAVVGSLGLARLSNFVKRLHGPTKATTLGVGCVLIASAIYFTWSDAGVSVHELLIALFLFLTAPVSAQLMIKAAMKADPSIGPAPPGEHPSRAPDSDLKQGDGPAAPVSSGLPK